MTETQEVTSSGSHLVVLLYGLFGRAEHLIAIKKGLEGLYGSAMECLVIDTYKGWDSYVGIDTVAFPVFEEIKKQLHPNVRRHISIIGYSMGGLVGRFVIGLLQLDGCLGRQLIPHTYISLATPHAGVLSGFGDDISWAPRLGGLLSRSHEQMTMGDKGYTLLQKLYEGKVFVEGLQKFKMRYAYGNLHNDKRVTFESATLGCSYNILISVNGIVQLDTPETAASNLIPEEETQSYAEAPSKGYLYYEELPPGVGKMVSRTLKRYVKASCHRHKQAPRALTDEELGISSDSSPKKSPKALQDWIMQQEFKTNLFPYKIAVRNPDNKRGHYSIVGFAETIIGQKVTSHVVELFRPVCQPPLGFIDNGDSALSE